jgi:hypothetical protein
MRTPGRCTNELTCAKAKAGRDIWVRVGEPFDCPACGARLAVPPHVMSGRGRASGALVGFGAFVLAAGIGFGIAPLTRSAAASVSDAAPAIDTHTTAMASGPALANAPAAPTLRPETEVVLNSVTLAPATVLIHQSAATPISYGKPVGPEDEAPSAPRHWHHRVTHVHQVFGFLPAPVDTAAAEETAPVDQIGVVAQGDSDDSDSDSMPSAESM